MSLLGQFPEIGSQVTFEHFVTGLKVTCGAVCYTESRPACSRAELEQVGANKALLRVAGELPVT